MSNEPFHGSAQPITPGHVPTDFRPIKPEPKPKAKPPARSVVGDIAGAMFGSGLLLVFYMWQLGVGLMVAAAVIFFIEEQMAAYDKEQRARALKWGELAPGMTFDQVKALLGEPRHVRRIPSVQQGLMPGRIPEAAIWYYGDQYTTDEPPPGSLCFTADERLYAWRQL